MVHSDTSVLVTGHAKPLKDDAIHTVYQVFSLSLIVETKTDCILDLACTTVMEESEEFIRMIFRNKNIVMDMEELMDQIRRRFLTQAQKPLIVALKDAQNRYLTAYPEKRAVIEATPDEGDRG